MYGENNQDSSGKMQEKTGKNEITTLKDTPKINWYMKIKMHLQWSASH